MHNFTRKSKKGAQPVSPGAQTPSSMGMGTPLPIPINVVALGSSTSSQRGRILLLKPNTHRWRRRNSTVELSRVGVGGVYWVLNFLERVSHGQQASTYKKA